MILLLEFAWTKVRKTDPCVSRPTIIDILGATCFLGTELVSPLHLHFILLKSVIPSQVSSMLMTVVYFPRRALRRQSANYYLRIKFLGELAFQAIGFIFWYFIPNSFFMTFFTCHDLKMWSCFLVIAFPT